MCNEDYEFYDDWCNRDDEEYNIELDEYDEMRCVEEYGDSDCSIDDDDDSFDPY